MVYKTTYNDIMALKTYVERVRALQELAFGVHSTERHITPSLYRTKLWKEIRNRVVVRDSCNDLCISERPILDRPVIHHINCVTSMDSDGIYDMDNLILTSLYTHNLIHYGGDIIEYTPRQKGDTILW